MLWYKCWLDTRARFLLGLGLLVCFAAFVVLGYPTVVKLLPTIPNPDGLLGDKLREAVKQIGDYRHYLWSQWFGKNMRQLWTLFALLLGAGNVLTSSAPLFTLSLPATRSQWMWTRAITGLAQSFVLALLPSLVLPLLSPAIGQSYPVADALAHSLAMFVAGTVFFAVGFLLSTMYPDLWHPLAVGIGVWAAIAAAGFALGDNFNLLRVMSAEDYFNTGILPWKGMLISAVLSAALLLVATKNVERQDF